MKIIGFRALASRVLVVAVERLDVPNAWTAYIDSCPGVKHREEIQKVAENGTKLDMRIAKLVFPEFSGPYIK